MANRQPASVRQISSFIRTEIEGRRLSQYRIALETGIKQPSLSRFLRGGSLRLETAAVLLDFLGYRIVPKTLRGARSETRAPSTNVSKVSGLRNRHDRQEQAISRKRRRKRPIRD
jgi:predicted XRE-type DNA-binding protein